MSPLAFPPTSIGPNRCLTITKKDCRRQLVTWLSLSSDSLNVLHDLVQRFPPTSSYCGDLQSSELLEPGGSARSQSSNVALSTLCYSISRTFSCICMSQMLSKELNFYCLSAYCDDMSDDCLTPSLDSSVDKNKRSWLLHNGIPMVPQKRTLTLLDSVRRSLPVFDNQVEILQLLRENRVLLVLGDTGSGKTTQVGV